MGLVTGVSGRECPHDLEILRGQSDVSECDFLIVHEFFDLVGGHTWKKLFYSSDVVAKFLAKNWPVGNKTVADAVFLFVGGEDKVFDIQLFQNVLFDGLDVVQIQWIVVYYNKLSQRHLHY